LINKDLLFGYFTGWTIVSCGDIHH